MKINKRSLSCLATLIIIAMVISPNIIQKAMIFDNGNGDDDSFSPLITPPPPPIISTPKFPDDSYTYINNLIFSKGLNNTGNLTECIESLKYDDGEKLEIEGESGLGGYYYNIEFYYNISLLDNIPTTIDFYDFYINLKIDSSLDASIVYLQGFDGIDWYNIIEISNDQIHITHYLLTNTPKIRIYHPNKIISQKIISIEKFYILLCHNNKFPFVDDLKNVNVYDYSHTESNGDDKVFNFNPDWWQEDTRDTKIYQQTIGDAVIPTTFWTSFWCDMQLTNSIYYTEDYTIENAKIKGYSYPYLSNAWANSYNLNGYIYNFAHDRLDYKKNISGSTLVQKLQPKDFIFDWTSDLQSDPNYMDYINPITSTWTFHIYCEIETEGNFLGRAGIRLDYYFSRFNWTSSYSSDSFPIIEKIYTDPPSPISPTTQFQIRTNTNSLKSYISKTIYYIENYSETWTNMDYLFGHIWASGSLHITDFPEGVYRVWINTFDRDDYSSLGWYDFIISNTFPKINFITPETNGEKIEQLYNYNINISISDFENDDFENAKLLLYKDYLDNPFIDWTNMEFSNLEPDPEGDILYYNYSFNPINYENGIYKIRIKTNDSRKIEIIKEINILIENNPPSIEIINPSLTELIEPYTQQIICNITNEDPINTAQWDIIPNLNINFTWKILFYNITTKLWESNFSILNYEYGDYYLVINTTDDKYNTSLEIQSIQIHPLIIHYIREIDISYNSDGITVYPNELISTEILGEIELTHHPIVKERDWEIYLPEKYDDAKNYYIIHGFERYEPLGILVEGIYTKWHIPDFHFEDLIHFNLEKPRIINNLIEEDEDGTLKFKFSLISKYKFSSLTINNQFQKYIDNPKDYEYSLYFLSKGDWKEIDDFDVDEDVFPLISFIWAFIGEESTISFKVEAVPIDPESSNIVGYLLFGFGILALVNVPFQIYGLTKKNYRKEGKGWGITRYVGISIALAVGSFFGGFGIGYFVYG